MILLGFQALPYFSNFTVSFGSVFSLPFEIKTWTQYSWQCPVQQAGLEPKSLEAFILFHP